MKRLFLCYSIACIFAIISCKQITPPPPKIIGFSILNEEDRQSTTTKPIFCKRFYTTKDFKIVLKGVNFNSSKTNIIYSDSSILDFNKALIISPVYE
jgi:hypothetical protein